MNDAHQEDKIGATADSRPLDVGVGPAVSGEATHPVAPEPHAHESRLPPPGMADGPITGRILRLAWPVAAQGVLTMLVGWSDTIITGRYLGTEPLAAITVAAYLLWMIECCGELVAAGTAAVVARLVGAADQEEANRILQQSLLWGALLGVLLLFTVFTIAPALVTLLNLTGPARDYAIEYLRTLALSCPLMTLMLIGLYGLRAAGYTLVGMWIVGTVNVVNIGLSWYLGPDVTVTLPGGATLSTLGWGVRGVAIGTAVAFSTGGLLALLALWYGFPHARLPRQWHGFQVAALRRLLRIGVPGAANALTVVGCQLWYLSIVNSLGSTATAAHGAALRCESIAWLTGEAFAVAAATLVGQSLGAGRLDYARRCGWTAFFLGAAAMSLLGVCFFTFAPTLIGLFVGDTGQAVLDQGVPILRLVSFAMPGLAATIILTGALRGAGDTRWPLLYNTVGFLLVRIPLAFWLTNPVMGLGLFGAWIAMVTDLFARGLFAVLRYAMPGWASTRV